MTHVTVHPGDLTKALDNAVACSNEKVAAKRVEHVLLAFSKDALLIYGMSAYLAGKTTVAVDQAIEEYVEVSILRSEAEATASLLRKCSKAKDARVSVALHAEPEITRYAGDNVWANVVIQEGAEVLVALPDSDPDGKFEAYFAWMDRRLGEEPFHVRSPVLMAQATLNRLKDVKSDGVHIDLQALPGKGVLRVKLGSNFDGLMAEVDAEAYGKKEPTHLLLERAET